MSALQKKPEIVVFADPNGSGKSTFTELLKPPMDYINADEIKKNFTRCYYILTADPMINVLRVQSRVESGGHDVPKEKIVTRYDKALALVKDLIKICDICHIYDNSGSKPFRILKKRKEQVYYDECADWYFEDIQALTKLRNMEKKNLN